VPLFLRLNIHMSEILLMSDLLDIRARKLKELEFYNHQLKMAFIQQEINLTNKIVDMIQKETIIDIGLYIKKNI
jgi:hypothetical protein